MIIQTAFWNDKYKERQYVFNRQVGVPQATRPMQQEYFKKRVGQPVTFSDHAMKQMRDRDIKPTDIPEWDGNFPRAKNRHGGAHAAVQEVKIGNNGQTMRAAQLRMPAYAHPTKGMRDVSMVIDDTGNITTVMDHPLDPNHRDFKGPNHVFNANTVHFPEEFVQGHAPSRTWDPQDKTTPFAAHTDPKVKENILKEHGAVARKATMGIQPGVEQTAFKRLGINFEKLAALFYRNDLTSDYLI